LVAGRRVCLETNTCTVLTASTFIHEPK